MAEFTLKPNPLVDKLGLTGPEVLATEEMLAAGPISTTQAIAVPVFTSSETPDRCTCTGYLGKTFSHRDTQWTVLFLDEQGRSSMLLETAGIIGRSSISSSPGTVGTPDVIVMKADATVGWVRRSVSLEGLFLSGEWMRANDLDLEPLDGGGSPSASGGFCPPKSPRCCFKTHK
jgi:hypothetical protein